MIKPTWLGLSLVAALLATQSLSLLPKAAAHDEHRTLDPNALLFNSSFAEGNGVPDHWLLVPTRGVAAVAQVDRQDTHSAPGSLRLSVNGLETDAPTGADAPTPGAKVQQILARKPKRPVTIAGWFKKGEGVTAARVVLRVKNQDWTTELATLAAPNQPGIEWTPFTFQATVPADAGAVLLSFEVEGQGTAWLDCVTLTEAPAETPAP